MGKNYIRTEDLDNIEEIVKATIPKAAALSAGAGKSVSYGKKIWTPELLDMRNRWIIAQLVKKGKSLNEVRAYIRDNWGLSYGTSESYVKEALNSLAQVTEAHKALARTVHYERLEDLYARAVEHNKIDSALKVLEQMAKINGYYNDTMVVQMPVLQFKFGDDDNLIYMKKNDGGGEDAGGLQTI